MEIRIDRLKSLLKRIDLVLVPLKCGTVNKIHFNDLKHMISVVLYTTWKDKTHLEIFLWQKSRSIQFLGIYDKIYHSFKPKTFPKSVWIKHLSIVYIRATKIVTFSKHFIFGCFFLICRTIVRLGCAIGVCNFTKKHVTILLSRIQFQKYNGQ